jgi:hypothetical protein
VAVVLVVATVVVVDGLEAVELELVDPRKVGPADREEPAWKLATEAAVPAARAAIATPPTTITRRRERQRRGGCACSMRQPVWVDPAG